MTPDELVACVAAGLPNPETWQVTVEIDPRRPTIVIWLIKTDLGGAQLGFPLELGNDFLRYGQELDLQALVVDTAYRRWRAWATSEGLKP